ncbi:MAG: helix-turn-helix domain-containing protein [Deltaproteobacteria bacterium]|nr:helix-turn-helix domain-containing protein [Deltaproteobacteria bacterium]
MSTNDLFTAPQVAKICSTDLKTIHNWVNRGEIKFFRTPGRHLRFRRQDVLEFLVKFGYPIPDGFAPARPKAIVIDPSQETGASIAQALSDEMEVTAFADHFDALLQIGKDKPSLVLVNCKDNPEMLKVVQNISKHEKDLPIVVYGSDTIDHDASKNAGAMEVIQSTDVTSVKIRIADIVQNNLKAAV